MSWHSSNEAPMTSCQELKEELFTGLLAKADIYGVDPAHPLLVAASRAASLEAAQERDTLNEHRVVFSRLTYMLQMLCTDTENFAWYTDPQHEWWWAHL